MSNNTKAWKIISPQPQFISSQGENIINKNKENNSRGYGALLKYYKQQSKKQKINGEGPTKKILSSVKDTPLKSQGISHLNKRI